MASSYSQRGQSPTSQTGLSKNEKVKTTKSSRLSPQAPCCWIKSSPAGPPASESLSMSTGSAALTSASLGNKLFFCPYPACFGSTAVLGAARKEREVLANARRPPPVLPAQIRRESVRGGGNGNEEGGGGGRQGPCVSVPSVPPVPSPSVAQTQQ